MGSNGVNGVNGANGHSAQKAQSYARSAFEFAQRQANRVVSPEARQRGCDATTSFAVERPLLFTFVVSQLLFCALPVALFVSFSLSTAVFALVSAVVFALFWFGVALLVLVPILFFTSGIAILVWLWAAATILIGRWAYQMLLGGGDAASESGNKQIIYSRDRGQKGGNNVKEEAADIKG